LNISGSPRLLVATCFAAAWASVFERPTMNVSKVSRGSSGEPPSASCTLMKGMLARAFKPSSGASRPSRTGKDGSSVFGLAAGRRIVEERTLSSSRVTSGSSDCHLSSTFSL
jgi:hypothetical protein